VAEAHRDRFTAHREFDRTAEAFPVVLAHRNLRLVRGLTIVSPADADGKAISEKRAPPRGYGLCGLYFLRKRQIPVSLRL
jgi:hypothetical protein